MILYLHGFLSSPASFKARLLAEAMEQHGLSAQWVCPQLPMSPAEVMALCNAKVEQAREQGLDPARELVIIGSSLGGFYATHLAEQWQCRAVVLNPATNPARTLAAYLGTQTRFHSAEPVEFCQAHLDELAALGRRRPARPGRYYLLACKGDEVLDWRDMAEWYAGSQGHILDGGNHSISDFARWLSEVLEFALAPDPDGDLS
ncbi:MAG: YqiA/YcfP family alpha/beta fold hydrolase [Castellaniella sp.]